MWRSQWFGSTSRRTRLNIHCRTDWDNHHKFWQENRAGHLCIKTRISQSVQRLATDWTVQGSIAGGVRFSAPVQTCPGAHPAFCTMCTGSFVRVKPPGSRVNHRPPSSAVVKESIHPYSPSAPSWTVLGRTSSLPSLLTSIRVAVLLPSLVSGLRKHFCANFTNNTFM
jgi:hypothetical protein